MNQTSEAVARAAVSLARKDVVTFLYNMYNMVCPPLWHHSKELADAAEALARTMQWDEKKVRVVYLGCLFHDVGHLMVPSELSYWTRGTMPPKMDLETDHPAMGVRLLNRVKSMEDVLPIIKHHHENFDGSGFPDGLEGAQIPEEVRLTTVVHSYLTLIRGMGSTRPMSENEARQVVREDAGIRLDPQIVEVFMENLPSLGAEDYSQTK
jgi:putative nucleotidyltransferase with HDIG domain